MPTVFIVDDEERIRVALRRLLQSVGLESKAYGSAQEFIDDYNSSQPGCLVLDVRMPGLSGLDLQDRLAAGGRQHIPIVFITGHGDVPMSVRAMRAGAVDFIQKPFTDQVLLDAIQRAIEQDERSRQEVAGRRDVLERVEMLTPREREVLERIVAGKLNKQAAAELGISVKTVKIHRAHVMEKMKAKSVPHLVGLARAAGIWTPTETTE